MFKIKLIKLRNLEYSNKLEMKLFYHMFWKDICKTYSDFKRKSHVYWQILNLTIFLELFFFSIFSALWWRPPAPLPTQYSACSVGPQSTSLDFLPPGELALSEPSRSQSEISTIIMFHCAGTPITCSLNTTLCTRSRLSSTGRCEYQASHNVITQLKVPSMSESQITFIILYKCLGLILSVNI